MAIETINGNTQAGHSASWNVAKSSGLPASVYSIGSLSRTITAYSFGTGLLSCNQIIQQTLTIAGGATNNLVLSGTLTNVLGEASATLTAIKQMFIELLNTDQGGGANATSITCGAHATLPWITGPLGATDTLTVRSGEIITMETLAAAGWAVAAGKILKIVNNDGVNSASVRITIFGLL